jgi:hypothetical protein
MDTDAQNFGNASANRALKSRPVWNVRAPIQQKQTESSPFPPFASVHILKTTRKQNLLAAALACVLVLSTTHSQAAGSPYQFERGFSAAGTDAKAYAAPDLRRAIEAYKFFYLTLSTEAVMQQGQAAGAKVNEVGIAAARFFAPTNIAPGTWSARAARVKSAPPATTSAFAA